MLTFTWRLLASCSRDVSPTYLLPPLLRHHRPDADSHPKHSVDFKMFLSGGRSRGSAEESGYGVDF